LYALSRLVELLPLSLQPYAKAVIPTVLTVSALAVQWAATGEFDKAEFTTALTGLIGAAVTFLVPNK
jgi:hypothetical protein